MGRTLPMFAMLDGMVIQHRGILYRVIGNARWYRGAVIVNVNSPVSHLVGIIGTPADALYTLG